MNKLITAIDAISQIEDGMTVGIGGWGARRKPMALVRELCRSDVKDLTIVAYGGPDVGLLCSAGKVREVVFGFVSLDVIPLDAHFRHARENGLVEAREFDEGMLFWGLYAASLRLPFLPLRAGLASDVPRLDPSLQTIVSPYADGETLMAVPALPLDVALLHADRADVHGNGQVLGPDPHFDDVMAGAAKRTILSCEQVVPTEQFLADGCLHSMHLSRALVDHVVEAPFGAHPTSCVPSYGIDEEALADYQQGAGEGWGDYRSRRVDVTELTYLDAVGGADHVSATPVTVF